MSLSFDEAENVLQRCDFRHAGLHCAAGYALGLDPGEQVPSTRRCLTETAGRNLVGIGEECTRLIIAEQVINDTKMENRTR